jgi:hypothetical protein
MSKFALQNKINLEGNQTTGLYHSRWQNSMTEMINNQLKDIQNKPSTCGNSKPQHSNVLTNVDHASTSLCDCLNGKSK